MNRTRKTSGTLTRQLLRACIGLSIICAAAGISRADQHYLDQYWQQQADYDIHVTLDTENKTLTGTVTIKYTNNSPDSLTEFHLHLYPNAYREKATPLIRNYMRSTLYFFVGLRKSLRGWIDVTTLSVNGKEAEFTVDYTILESSFPQPLPPGGEATIEVSFTEKIRKKLGRAGWSDDHYDMAQWYPKMVVYDKNGWHPDPFLDGEFYGEFGTFDVHITLPDEYVIAATGVPVSGDPGWDKNPLKRGSGGRGHRGGNPGAHPGGQDPAGESGGEGRAKTVHFRAEKVHDFAWCADPTFVVQDTTYNGIHVMSIFREHNRAWVDTTLAQTLRAIKWLEETVGPYPYPQVSTVDAPGHGGMEYPMLAMNGYVDEGLVVHEFAHNYFYGVLANDEREDAWLDEGFAQYMSFWYAVEKYGPHGTPEGDQSSWINADRPFWEDIEVPVIKQQRMGFAERISTPHHEFKNGAHTTLYLKAPLLLRTLHYALGDETFRKVLKEYYERWKFKHVDEDAFISVCEEISGIELSETFKQWLHTTKDSNYRVDRFKVKKSDEGYTADVKIDRKGELIAPLTLAFRLENGNMETERERGLYRTIEKSYTFDSKPVSLQVNPENEILDIYQLDNNSPRKRSLVLDNPWRDYYPQDAYEFRLVPSGYYNDIDGGKVLLRLRGGYADFYRKFTLIGYYGFVSERFDIYANFDHPLNYFGRDASIYLEGFHREGRQGASMVISKALRKSLTDPLGKFLEFRVFYHELFDSSYVYPHTYSEGRDVKIGLNFSIYPKTDLFATSFSFDLDRSIWGSDFGFEKSTVELKIWPSRRFDLPFKPHLRFFLGYSSIDPPLQERFRLAGAGVFAKEKHFWLRSVGAWPKDSYNNFHLPGEGNLRGYYNGDYSFKRLFTGNIELDMPFPLPVSRQTSRKLDRRLYAFFDWGTVLDTRPLEAIPPELHPTLEDGLFDEVLTDFGVGIKIWRLVGEFPLYINQPSLAGEENKWDFRWTISFWTLF